MKRIEFAEASETPCVTEVQDGLEKERMPAWKGLENQISSYIPLTSHPPILENVYGWSCRWCLHKLTYLPQASC